jgi:hypothetical protein
MYELDFRTAVCSVGAFAAGALSKWTNGGWTAGPFAETPRPRMVALVYVAISLAAVAGSVLVTGVMQQWAQSHVAPHHGYRMVLVAASYLLVQCVQFVVKLGVHSEASRPAS